jgi:hypothetical protein
MESLGFVLTVGHIGGKIFAGNSICKSKSMYQVYSAIYLTIWEVGRGGWQRGTSDNMLYL